MGLKHHVKRLMRQTFEVGQQFKVDILPRHFYSEVPFISQLRSSEAWRRPRSMKHIAGADLESQQSFVVACTEGLASAMTSRSIHQRACQMNNLAEGFGPIEADFLYCFVRSQKPPCIVQIGCGVSTAICILAAADAGYQPEIVCIEPYPTPFLVEQAAAGKIRLVAEKFEVTQLPIPEMLQGGGLFFVDSSHTLGPAGEVTQIICDTLPDLLPGTWVHFHDILFPYDYSPDILTSELFFCHETTLLHAFLIHNHRFSIAASLSMLHHAQAVELGKSLPNYRPAKFDQGLRLGSGHHPSSIYLRAQ
jgi:Methyltransferase domain